MQRLLRNCGMFALAAVLIGAPAHAQKDKDKDKEKDKGSIEMVSDKGMIGVLVEPEATVTVDGQLIGKTPIGAHPLKPGMHTFVLSNPKLGKTEKLRIEIFSGENPPIVRNWNAKR